MPPSFFWRTSSGFFLSSCAIAGAGRTRTARNNAAGTTRIIPYSCSIPCTLDVPDEGTLLDKFTTLPVYSPPERGDPGEFREPRNVRVLEWTPDALDRVRRDRAPSPPDLPGPGGPNRPPGPCRPAGSPPAPPRLSRGGGPRAAPRVPARVLRAGAQLRRAQPRLRRAGPGAGRNGRTRLSPEGGFEAFRGRSPLPRHDHGPGDAQPRRDAGAPARPPQRRPALAAVRAGLRGRGRCPDSSMRRAGGRSPAQGARHRRRR